MLPPYQLDRQRMSEKNTNQMRHGNYMEQNECNSVYNSMNDLKKDQKMPNNRNVF